MEFKGIIPAIPTPFDAHGAINLPMLGTMLEFLINAGVHGVFVVGNAGEFYALDPAEKRMLLKKTIEVAGNRIPIFFGAGSAYTAEAVQLSQMAEEEGATALSVITPFLIKPNEEELYQYYKAICEATHLPVFIYNNPAITGVPMSSHLVSRLSQLDNLLGIKDSSGDFALTLEFLQLKKPGFSVFAGRDNLILPTMLHGGKGAISSIASACPEIAVAIYRAFERGDMQEAVRRQMQFAQLRQLFNLGTFPSVIKAALEIRGFAVGAPRAPVMTLPDHKRKELAQCLHDVLLDI